MERVTLFSRRLRSLQVVLRKSGSFGFCFQRWLISVSLRYGVVRGYFGHMVNEYVHVVDMPPAPKFPALLKLSFVPSVVHAQDY